MLAVLAFPLESAGLDQEGEAAGVASLADAKRSNRKLAAGSRRCQLAEPTKKRAPEQIAPAPVLFRLGSLPLYCFVTFAA